MHILRPFLFSVLLFCCCASSAPAQSRQPAKVLGGVVAGRVTEHGKGLPGVTVTLRTWSQGGQSQDMSFPESKTDGDGKYRLTGVPMGSYFVMPVAPLYTQPDAGRLTSSNTQVVITGNEAINDIDFALVKGGVITGRVTDTESKPIIEQTVSLQNVDQMTNQGGPPMMAPGSFRTDDRGMYRIY